MSDLHTRLRSSNWSENEDQTLTAVAAESLGIAVDATTEHNVTRSVYFPDPDGNRVELYCDMVANGFEAMQTIGPVSKPLDIETGKLRE